MAHKPDAYQLWKEKREGRKYNAYFRWKRRPSVSLNNSTDEAGSFTTSNSMFNSGVGQYTGYVVPSNSEYGKGLSRTTNPQLFLEYKSYSCYFDTFMTIFLFNPNALFENIMNYSSSNDEILNRRLGIYKQNKSIQSIFDAMTPFEILKEKYTKAIYRVKLVIG